MASASGSLQSQGHAIETRIKTLVNNELREICRGEGLLVSGIKSQLQKRIIDCVLPTSVYSNDKLLANCYPPLQIWIHSSNKVINKHFLNFDTASTTGESHHFLAALLPSPHPPESPPPPPHPTLLNLAVCRQNMEKRPSEANIRA